jgi:hypothetical protein
MRACRKKEVLMTAPVFRSMRAAVTLVLVTLMFATAVWGTSRRSMAQALRTTEYRVLATNKTSTMEKELNQAADTGFRFQAAMGGDTAAGGSEVVTIMARSGATKGRFTYRLLAASKTSTLEKELQDAAAAGFEYRAQTVFDTTFGGEEVVCILERDSDAVSKPSTYRLVATTKTSTLEKELVQAANAGYEVAGMTVGKTAMGGNELVAILRRTAP